MTYNVFSGTLHPTQSSLQAMPHHVPNTSPKPLRR